MLDKERLDRGAVIVLDHLGGGGFALGAFGLLACRGAGGGLSLPGTNSKMGLNLS